MTSIDLTEEETIVLEAVIEQAADSFRSCPDPIKAVLPKDADVQRVFSAVVAKMRDVVHRLTL